VQVTAKLFVDFTGDSEQSLAVYLWAV